MRCTNSFSKRCLCWVERWTPDTGGKCLCFVSYCLAWSSRRIDLWGLAKGRLRAATNTRVRAHTGHEQESSRAWIVFLSWEQGRSEAQSG